MLSLILDTRHRQYQVLRFWLVFVLRFSILLVLGFRFTIKNYWGFGAVFTILFRCFITPGTCKWLVSCMRPFMHLQTRSVDKSIVEHGTGKWIFSSVGPFMHLQIATLVKSFFTFGTGKWQLCQNTLSSGNITHSGEKTYPCKQCEATCFFFRKDMPNFWSHCLQ